MNSNLFTNFEIMTNTTTPKVFFFFENITISIKNRTALKRFIEFIFKKEGKKLETLNYVFCTDDYLLQINREYLKHDYYTDIITFDLSESKTTLIGDIYISIDRVKENAKALNTTLQNETNRVMFHGVLHLCGYKDKTKSETIIMREKEEEYLALYSKSIRNS